MTSQSIKILNDLKKKRNGAGIIHFLQIIKHER